MMPLPRNIQFLALIVAIGLGFVVNGVRVAWLAILSTQNNPALFDYWHSNDGALLFVVATVLLFGLFCWVLLRCIPLSSHQG